MIMTSYSNEGDTTPSKSPLNTPQIRMSKPLWPTLAEKDPIVSDNLGSLKTLDACAIEPMNPEVTSDLCAPFDLDRVANLDELSVMEIRNLLNDPHTPVAGHVIQNPLKVENTSLPRQNSTDKAVLSEFLDLGASPFARQMSIPGIDGVIRSIEQSEDNNNIASFVPGHQLTLAPDFLDTDVDLSLFLAEVDEPEVKSEPQCASYETHSVPTEPSDVGTDVIADVVDASTNEVEDMEVTLIGGKVIPKDEIYWNKRSKNNVASRRSRLTRKQKLHQLEEEKTHLEKENAKLRAKVTKMTSMTREWKAKLLTIMKQ